jgi:nucleotide-binding universal stress UspA family protein
MFKHLVVPLDGSKLAEAALPVAAGLAQVLKASVTLLHIIERNPPEEVHGEPHLTDAAEAEAYLRQFAARAFPAGPQVETHVHTTEVGDVARSIVEHGEELAPDLVILCTHGRGGLRGLLYGSIAQQVVGHGSTPVLLIPPRATTHPAAFACRKLLIALDASSTHDEALQPAVELAQATGAVVHLLMVVPTLGTLKGDQVAMRKLLPGTMSAILDIEQDGAEVHLRQHREALETAGLKVDVEVGRGEPASVIVESARRAKADLIVLGTHGRIGVDALWSGSTAPKVSARSHLPLLLVPLGERPGGQA